MVKKNFTKSEWKNLHIDFSMVSYVFGITSIIFAFSSPLSGLIFGVVGIVHSRKQKTELSKKAKRLNIIGIILNLIFLITATAIMIYGLKLGDIIGSFPVIPQPQ